MRVGVRSLMGFSSLEQHILSLKVGFGTAAKGMLAENSGIYPVTDMPAGDTGQFPSLTLPSGVKVISSQEV